jgi:hypothetical protein
LDSITILQKQFASIFEIFQSIVGDLTENEMIARPAPGQNMICYTVWHMPRTLDAHVQTWIRGVPEVVHGEGWSDWKPLKHLGYGVGVSLNEADEIASTVKVPDVLKYADEVHHEITTWLQRLDERDLDQMPEISKHLSPYPEYQTEGLRREAGDLFEQPTWPHLLYPCIGHIQRHLGELEIIKTIIRTNDER